MKLRVYETKMTEKDVALTYCPLSDDFNDLPDAPVKPLHELEAAHLLRVGGFNITQHKYIPYHYKKHPEWLPDGYYQVVIHFGTDHAIVQASNGKWTIDGDRHIVYEPSLWWRYGCSHPNLKHTTPYNCYHTYTCPDCKTTWSIDSSG